MSLINDFSKLVNGVDKSIRIIDKLLSEKPKPKPKKKKNI